jgi:hypothetical protein
MIKKCYYVGDKKVFYYQFDEWADEREVAEAEY